MNGAGQLAPPTKQKTNVHELILRELQHRVANSLTILHASCHLDFVSIADPELRGKLQRHGRRIHDLAELHHFFSRGAGGGGIAAAQYFHSLCALLNRSILAPLALHCETCIGEGVLDGSTCEWLGLVVAELVTNAAKHAFPDRHNGCVRVEIYALDAMAWCCTVTDNGCGIRPITGGTGSQIVNALVQMLDGQMSIDTGRAGTTVTILFPGVRSWDHPRNDRFEEVTSSKVKSA
jgi:two-component sensor histidine kinase